jgi:hypothetical protein
MAIGILFGFALTSSPAQPGSAPGAAAPAAPKPKASPTPRRDSPQTVTQRYLTAVVEGDEAAGKAQLCGLLRDNGPGDLNLPVSVSDLVGIEVAEGTVTGPTAKVPVKLSLPLLGSTDFSVYLVDERGAWRVCGVGPK